MESETIGDEEQGRGGVNAGISLENELGGSGNGYRFWYYVGHSEQAADLKRTSVAAAAAAEKASASHLLCGLGADA